ncbi:hypothetical protein GF366_04370 [Candidatus Peregrinibacteria bacterium]|nr:hypothetical protein [Candidatus Peregrinibacteria bacterium]
MALKASYEFLFVGRDDNSFLENYSYDLFQDYGDKSGQIFVNLEIQNNPVDAEEIGNVVFETMQKVFFEDVGKDSYERFEAALKSVNSVLNEFKSQKSSGYIGNLNIVVAAIVDDTLYLSQTGDAEAYLIRKHYVSIISEGLSEEEGESGDIFTNIASGSIEAGDFVLFSSTRLLRYISKTDLARCIGKGGVTDSLNEIKEIVSTEMLGRIGMTGIVFEEAKKEEVEKIMEEGEHETQTTLESADSEISARKGSITGKFITALKGYRRGKGEIFRGRGGMFNRMGKSLGNFWKSLFSKGFGKNKVLVLLVIVILALIVGIWIAKSNIAEKEEIKRLDEILVSVQDKIAEAETKGTYDKETAKAILDQAYEDAMVVLNSGYYRDKAILVLTDIEETRDDLDNVIRIENPNVLADLSKKRSDVNALGFVEVGDRFFVFEYNALYEIVLDQVQDPLTIDDEETVIAATGFDDQNSVIFLTKSGKLIEYREGIMSFMDTDDGSFHKAVSIDDWSNRIYLLDPNSSQIWKYTYKGTSEKFGGAESYLTEDVDISNAVDFAIDANIYVLLSNGDIWKFYAGSRAEFNINNPPFNAFKNPTVIYTNEKLDEVYVLDSSEARVLVFKKDSQSANIIYDSQYLFEGVGDLRDIYVDPDARKLYVLTENNVLDVEI